MANFIKKAVFNLMEQVISPSEIIEVRAWEPATLYEIDVHLPTTDFTKWNTIKRVKCKVADFEYRDYTPALWNAEKKVCTLYVEAGHNGAGGRWAKNVKVGDELLLGVAHAAQLPANKGKVLGIADGSALGHFLSQKQLLNQEEYPTEVGVFLHDNYQIPSSLISNNPEFEFICEPDGNMIEALEKWCLSKDLSNYTSICIAGNTPMVTTIRKKLKAIPAVSAKIYAYGFWK